MKVQVNMNKIETSLPPVQQGIIERAKGPGRREEECRRRRQTLQRRAVTTDEVSEVPPIVYEVLRSPGQPLDPSARAFFEPRFRHDFSRVRVHSDARAAKSAESVGALAYTVGRDVVFRAGQYEPHTQTGKRLMAHELTHVVQQGAGVERNAGIAGYSDEHLEREANQATNSIDRGESVSGITADGLRLSRNGEDDQTWGGFRIYGDSAFRRAVRADLDQLNATAIGSALLGEIAENRSPWYRSRIAISPGPCGFLPNSGISYRTGGCNVRNVCEAGGPDWTAAPNYVYLFHEIVHAYLYHIAGRGTHRDRECMTTGLGRYFTDIRYSENRLRCELGLPVRPCYDGECRRHAAPACGRVETVGPTYGLTSDERIREWVRDQDLATVGGVSTAEKIRMINRLLDGWVSSEDMAAIRRICASVTTASEMATIRSTISPRELDLTDIGQRTQLRLAINRL